MEIRGQLSYHVGCDVWWQMLLTTEPPHQLHHIDWFLTSPVFSLYLNWELAE